MTSTPKPPKGRDGVLITLDLFIQGLDLAKDACGIPPAQAVFASASVLLAMIKVRFTLLCEVESVIHLHLGHDGQCPRLHRPWAILR